MSRKLLKEMMIEQDKRVRIMIMRMIVITLFMSCILGGCSYINKQLGLKNDHPAEQLLEFYIEKEIGIEIDLSCSNKK